MHKLKMVSSRGRVARYAGYEVPAVDPDGGGASHYEQSGRWSAPEVSQ